MGVFRDTSTFEHHGFSKKDWMVFVDSGSVSLDLDVGWFSGFGFQWFLWIWIFERFIFIYGFGGGLVLMKATGL